MFEGKDEIIIMQEDLKKALAKKSPKWAMLIDTRKCTLCLACTVGCMVEYKLPPGIRYRPVYETESGSYPKVKRSFVARPCQQCDNPPCVSACPNQGKATYKEKAGVGSGIVMINYEQCIGCGRCIPACPYGARNLDTNGFHAENAPFVPEMEKGPWFEYGRKFFREGKQIPFGNARKCHFCYPRLKKGILPMCVTTCICRATYFGDLSDESSLISKMIKANTVVELEGIKEFHTNAKAISDKKFKLKNVEWEKLIDEARKAYPGKTPHFGRSYTKPRVFYII